MPTRLQITIDLELTDPVSGSIAAPGGPATAFSGWLELHAALENLCAGAAVIAASTEQPLP